MKLVVEILAALVLLGLSVMVLVIVFRERIFPRTQYNAWVKEHAAKSREGFMTPGVNYGEPHGRVEPEKRP
jgi:lipopolysaccharide export LptBFGC system permease protein LptF